MCMARMLYVYMTYTVLNWKMKNVERNITLQEQHRTLFTAVADAYHTRHDTHIALKTTASPKM